MRSRVLFLDHVGVIGGAELAILDVARAYRDTSTVVLFADGPFRGRLASEGIRVEVVEGSRQLHAVRRETRLPSIGALTGLLSLVRRLVPIARQYDCLHANTQKAFVTACLAGHDRAPSGDLGAPRPADDRSLQPRQHQGGRGAGQHLRRARDRQLARLGGGVRRAGRAPGSPAGGAQRHLRGAVRRHHRRRNHRRAARARARRRAAHRHLQPAGRVERPARRARGARRRAGGASAARRRRALRRRGLRLVVTGSGRAPRPQRPRALPRDSAATCRD